MIEDMRVAPSKTAGGRHKIVNIVRLMLAVVWRARAATVPFAAVFVGAVVALNVVDGADARLFILTGAAFANLLILIAVLAMRVRAYVNELSRQILDVADGSYAPPEGAVMTALEIETELSRLQEEIEALKRREGLRSGPG